MKFHGVTLNRSEVILNKPHGGKNLPSPPSHQVIFCSSCLATPLRGQLHELLQRVTPRAMAKKIVARQVADIVSETKMQLFFSQWFQFQI